jgi:uncharacterized protein (DUF58 family)
LLVFASLAALGLVAGLSTGRVDLLVYASPFVVALLVGLAVSEAPVIEVDARVDATRALEGDPVDLVVVLRAATAIGRLDLAAVLPSGMSLSGGVGMHSVALDAGETREVVLPLVAERWGSFALGEVSLRAWDRLSLNCYEHTVAAPATIRVYPHPHRLRRLAHPIRTQHFAGDRVARRAAGEGIELADLRVFQPGDRLRDINWRASARRNELWITQRHPERSTNVVLFVDMFSDAMLLPAVRAAGTLADSYLAVRDRVGLVGFGGLLQWVRPGQGVTQLYRLLDTLLDARAFFSYAWKDVSIIPPRVLPPGALVIGISPLEDERATGALVDLRARGFDVAIIELSERARLAPPRTEIDVLARRLWEMQRADNRERFRQFGIPVAEWRDDLSLDLTMEAICDAWGVRGARHHALRVP